MRYSWIVVLVALLVAGCQSGPAGGTCASEDAAVANPTGGGAAAAASGGQQPSSEGSSSDRGRIQPVFPISRGAGDQDVKVESAEGRTVTTGPAITMGLQIPTDAVAAKGSAISQSVLQYRSDIAALQRDAQVLLASGNSEAYMAVLDRISRMQNELVAAERGCAANVTQIYFQDRQRVVFSNVSGTSGAGGDPKKQPGAVSDTAAAVTGASLAPVGAAAMAGADDKEPTPAEVNAARAQALRRAAEALDPQPAPTPAAFPAPAAPKTGEAPSGTPTVVGEDGKPLDPPKGDPDAK